MSTMKVNHFENNAAEPRNLVMENPERSKRDCDDWWIYCGDGNNLPKEHDSMFVDLKGTNKWNDAMFEKISDDVNVTVEHENGKRKTLTLHTIYRKWKTDRITKFKIIAWMPLLEPYKPQ